MHVLRSPKFLAFGAVALLGLLVDQLTKAWIVANVTLYTGEIPLIPGWLSLVHEQNTGAAFSTFEGGFPLFIAFTVVALVVLGDMLRRLKPDAVWTAATLGLILSGALGNFVDRLRHQYVVDFIRVYTDLPAAREWLVDNVGSATYPIFNVADIAIVVGVLLFFLLGARSTAAAEEKPSSLPEPAADPT